ncbi:MAG: acyltransferase family protein [Clostridiales bacterium]|nr:acyltransferase family protein [Clostridiales bacterium]
MATASETEIPPSRPLSKSRVDYLDFARGLCFIAVVLGHLSEPAINRFVFTFHLPVFLIITGYFINPNTDIITLIKKKLKSLIIPYYIACFLLTLSSIIIRVFKDHINIKGILKLLELYLAASVYAAGENWNIPFFILGIGAIWFLWASFWSVMIFWVVKKLPTIPGILIVAALVVAAKYIAEYVFFPPLSILPGCIAVLYVYAGYVWRKYFDRLATLKLWIKALLILLSIVVWGEFVINFESFGLVNCDIGRGFQDVFASLCASAVVIGFSFLTEKYAPLITRPFCFIGKYSIVALTAHIIEQNTFPWNDLINMILGENASRIGTLLLLLAFKFVWISLFTIVITRFKTTRKLFALRT